MHPVTADVKKQVESVLDAKGITPNAQQQSMLDGKYADIDNWMAHKPDWVKDEDIKGQVKDVRTTSMLND